MATKGVGSHLGTAGRRALKGGRRASSRTSLAGRPRSSRVGVATIGSKLRQVDAEPTRHPKDPPPVKPRKPSPEMRALMAGWRPEERRRAQRAVDFIETNLRFFKGPAAGQPFRLPPWQESIVRRLFGRLRPDGTRQYRVCYVEVPRKNAKSSVAAAIALALLLDDDEAGPEIYCAAHDRQQAKIVFRTAKLMAERSPTLRGKVLPFQAQVELPDGTGFLRAISADSGSQQGLDAHGTIVDELHVHPDRELLDVLQTSQGARRNPITLICTTAGEAASGPCWDEHEYARKVLDGTIRDDAYLPVIYAADPKDDWTSPEVWRKANPNLGYSISEDYIREQCQKAKDSPAFRNSFLRYHLNVWTAVEEQFLPMDRWDLCATPPVDAAQLAGELCYGALDLSSTTDCTAWVLVFPRPDGRYAILPRIFLPAHDLVERSRKERVPYTDWARQGYLWTTAGEVVNHEEIEAQIERDCATFNVREIAYDPWGAADLVQRLAARGHAVVEERQGYATLSNPTKALLRLVLAGKIQHGGHPVLRWMAECCSVAQDPAGNIKPVKPDRRKSSKRIDGIVATVMGLDRAMRHGAVEIEQKAKKSCYETEQLAVI